MKKKNLSEPILALGLGGIGAVLRKLQLSYGFESSSRFAISGSLWNTAFFVFCVLAALVGLILALRRGSRYAEYPPASARSSQGVLSVLGGLLLGAGVIVRGFALSNAGQLNKIYTLLMVVLGILSAASTVSYGIGRLVGRMGKTVRHSLLVLPLFFCFGLVSLYIQNAENPVIWEYAISAIFMAAASFALFYVAAGVAGRYREKKVIFCRFLAAFFATVCLGQGSLSEILLATGTILLLLFFMGSGYAPEREEDI